MNMKRAAILLLCAVLILGVLSGCAKKDTTKPTQANPAAPTEPTQAPTEEYTLEREDGKNQLTFYWTDKTADYSTCDMWIWMPGADGRGYVFHPCESGAKVVLNVPEEITEVGFIVRRNCSDPGGTSWGEATKDFADDRFAIMDGPDTVIYLKPGDGGQYISTDGGKTLTQTKLFSLAAIVGMNQIQYFVTPAAKITSMDQVKVFDGSKEVEIESLSSLNNEVITGTITLAENLDFAKTYTVRIEGFEEKTAVPTKVFDSKEFIEQYTYDGNDLGAIVDGGETVFKLWAPTASKVVLNLFDAGDGTGKKRSFDIIISTPNGSSLRAMLFPFVTRFPNSTNSCIII